MNIISEIKDRFNHSGNGSGWNWEFESMDGAHVFDLFDVDRELVDELHHIKEVR